MNKILQQINRKIPLHAAKTSTKLLATKKWKIIGRLSRVQLFENQIVHRICQGDPEEDQMKCGVDADCCQQTWMKNVARRKFFTNLRRNLTMPPPCSTMLRRLTKKLDNALPSCINVLHTYGNKILTNVANPEEPLAWGAEAPKKYRP